MKYYFYMVDDTIGSLRRTDFDSNPIVLERWDGKAWIFSPETIAVTGLGSDADAYKEITKQEAEKFMKKKEATQTGQPLEESTN